MIIMMVSADLACYLVATWICLMLLVSRADSLSLPCDGIHVQDRVVCSSRSLTQTECEERGCCYDDNFHGMCFFPAGCKHVMATAGSHSAMLLLPGQDRVKGQSSAFMSMLSGGKWCERTADVRTEDYYVQVQLHGTRRVYVLADDQDGHRSHTPGGSAKTKSPGVSPSRLPFYVSHTWNYRSWSILELPDAEWEEGGDLMTTFVTRQFRLHPQPSRHVYPCVSINIISCPHDGFPDDPVTTTTGPTSSIKPRVIPTSNTTVDSRPRGSLRTWDAEYYKEADGRPSAITVGVIGTSLMISLTVLCVVIDLPTYNIHYKYACRNMRDLRRNLRRIRQYAAASINSSDASPENTSCQRPLVTRTAPLATVESHEMTERKSTNSISIL